MRREAEPDKGLLLDNEYRAQHYPFYKTVDREVFHLGSSECQCLEPMGDHVGGSVKEQPERVGSERATRHSVGAEIFQVLIQSSIVPLWQHLRYTVSGLLLRLLVTMKRTLTPLDVTSILAITLCLYFQDLAL